MALNLNSPYFKIQDFAIFWREKSISYFEILTDLGSLFNWEYTIWKIHDYSEYQILCEINFGSFEAPKTAILTNWAALNFDSFWHFQVWNFSKNQYAKPPKWLKWQFLTLWNQLKLIWRKIRVAGKLLNFITVYIHSQKSQLGCLGL